MPTGLTYSNAAHAVEVEVDRLTGAVRILRYVVVSDCGRQINPMIVDGQIIGGVVHGIGNALFERMIYDETAQPVSINFAEYLLPAATELPQIELISHVSPSPLNPLGVKGVGECGVIPAAAAIMSGDRACPRCVRHSDRRDADQPGADCRAGELGQLCRDRRRVLDAIALAEREGFEPPVRLRVLRISSAARSTTLPPLRGRDGN